MRRCAATSRWTRSAGAGLYLLSDLSSGVTGETHVDCGFNIVGMLAVDAAEPIREMLDTSSRSRLDVG